MSVHPLDPEIVRETNAWFYRSHPRGQELRGAPLNPTSAEDAEGRQAWAAEYRRRLAEKRAGSGHQPSSGSGTDPLSFCLGCCPTDFGVFVHGNLKPQQAMTLETEESVVLRADDIQAAGFGAGTYTWTTTSRRLSLGESSTASRVAKGTKVTVHAGSEPTGIPELGELVEVTRTQSHCAPITRKVRILINKCKLFRLAQPKIIAIATDKYLTPTTKVSDHRLPGGYSLGFGQDLTFAKGRTQPYGPSVGTTIATLESKMRGLLSWFASNDKHGKARRLFDAFLAKKSAVLYWSDTDLNEAAETHANIKTFISRALNAPNSPERSPGLTRIHQVLESAGWDINAAVTATGLGVPGFNIGSKKWQTGDFDNGLGVMINGIQHVIVVAKEYYYDRCNGEYYIKLEYVFYDVFGLDDDDIREFGADGGLDSGASQGITAWWQLQHQHGYAPLITRIALERQFRVPVPPPQGAGGARR